MYEDGETWGHGGSSPRIVQIGTQRDDFPGEQWLGKFSPSDTLRHMGLWQVQYTKGVEQDQGDLDYIEELVAATRAVSRG
jgi:hypothetical protein